MFDDISEVKIMMDNMVYVVAGMIAIAAIVVAVWISDNLKGEK